MPNETDTTVQKNSMDETQELPAFPARRGGHEGPDGDQLVSAQYKALQEAQFLHEETLRQLRDEIHAQKERISELTQNSGASSQPPARVDAILLRLSELERKIGQDAPDPLLNEIVHRLAALESNSGRGSDSKVERIAEQIEELRKRASTPSTDPRTDEMALRIASVEGSLRRAQQTLDAETLTEQIQDFQKASQENLEKISAELLVLRNQVEEAQQKELPDWSSRFDAIESRLETATKNTAVQELQELTARLAQLEEAQASDNTEARLLSVTEKVDEVSNRLADTADSAALAELRQRLYALESQPAPDADNALTEALAARIDQLQKIVESQSTADGVEALQLRLAALEQQDQQTPDAKEALAELRQRCDALADRVSTLTENEIFESRIASIEEKITSAPTGSSDLHELRQRLAALEDIDPRESDGRLAELTARLRSLELQSEQSTTAADSSRLDRLSSRLDQLELTGGSSGLTNQINELRERVAGLAAQTTTSSSSSLPDQALVSISERLAQLEASSPDPSTQALEGIAERLAQLETFTPATLERVARLEEQKQNAPAGNDHADAIAELRQRVDQIVSSNDGAVASDVLHELGLRIQALERGGNSSVSNDGLNAELQHRIERLESKLSEAASAPRELQMIADRLSFLEQSGAPSGEGGTSPRFVEQVIARYEELDSRLARMEETATTGKGADASGAMTEIAELRKQLIELQDSSSAGGPGISENFLGKLAEKISGGIARSEVKSIQTQMFVVYFFLALIGAMALSAFFMQ